MNTKRNKKPGELNEFGLQVISLNKEYYDRVEKGISADQPTPMHWD